MKTRKLPALLLIVLVCVGLYLCVDVVSTTISIYSEASSWRARRIDAAAIEAKYGYLQLKDGKINGQIDRLNQAVKDETIDYFVLKAKGQDLAFGSASGIRPRLEYEGRRLGEILEFPDLAYTSIHANGYDLTIGVVLPPESTVLWRIVQAYARLLIAEILGTLLAIFAGSAYFLRDFTSPLRALASRGNRRFEHANAKTAEGELLARGLASYEAEAARLAAQNFVLDAQILSGPRHELDSGKPPPYKFACTLVRTDVNDFTSIFASEQGPAFLKDVNAFFEQLTAIVSRYGGYIYEFIGDEAIFYFKDEDVPSSSLAALSALRDVNQAAAALCETTRRERGYSFYVKSSAAYGELTFGKQVRNFSLAGAPLIETVRILSHISEKNENKVYYGSEVASRANLLISSASVGSAVLKGLPGERNLFQMGPVRNFEEILGSVEAAIWTLAAYFRSDVHVQRTLEYLKAKEGEMSDEKFFGLLGMYRQYSLNIVSSSVRKAYVDLLSHLADRLADEPAGTLARERRTARLAAAVLSSRALVPKAGYDASVRDLFLRCLRSPAMRVIANALEAFAWFEPANDEVLFAHLRGHDNNRVRANLLLRDSIAHGFNRQVCKGFARMLESPNPYHLASALWSLGESAAHYRRQDPIYFESEARLQRLIERASQLAEYPNEMVSRQTKLLLRKAGRSLGAQPDQPNVHRASA